MKRWSILASVALIGSSAIGQTPATQTDRRTCPPAAPHGKSPSTTAPCPALPDSQSAGEKFPYPGETSPAPATKVPTPAVDSGAGNPFPYPGDPAASRSSSSSSSSSSGEIPDPDASLPDAVAKQRSGRRKLAKPERMQSDEDRETEDLTIAKFYQQSGDLKAAYLRTRDAVKAQPDDPEAHFALAQIAQRLSKKEEAVTEFQTYLKLDPEGSRLKAAQKALAALQ